MSWLPLTTAARAKLKLSVPELLEEALERWEIAPAQDMEVRPAIFLPHQLDKIRQTALWTVDEVRGAFRGGFASPQLPTYGYRLRDVDLVDGVLYGRKGVMHLRPRKRGWSPRVAKPRESIRGAVYESWIGNRWFGTWLREDCLSYPLAVQCGQPVTSAPRLAEGHVAQYEEMAGIQPVRVADVHFDELFLFEDRQQNTNKRDRATAFRRAVVGDPPRTSHAGVFIRRGRTGEQRRLTNEDALAEHLALRWGFQVIDPMQASVEQIASACGSARIVAGVEGSHLAHGLVTMPSSACLFVVQPPDRTECVQKLNTDRQGQGFAFVVADGDLSGFSVDLDDVDRTMDLVHSR